MDRYAVIGNPIAHSKSPWIHAAFARQTGQALRYEALLAPLDGFARTVAEFRAHGGRGLNVTVPFKLEAFALAERHTARAELAGAVNTLAFGSDGILGDNTDGAGLVRDLTAKLGCTLAGRRVLLLGAGGATRGAVLPIARAGAARIAIANRTAAKADELAHELAPHLGGVPLAGGGFDALAGEAPFDVVINATSASLGGDAPAVPPAAFAPGALAYDMVYGKGLTPFLKLAQAAGAARVADGVGMLVEQAAEAFAWWRGVRPDTREALTRLTVPLV